MAAALSRLPSDAALRRLAWAVLGLAAAGLLVTVSVAAVAPWRRRPSVEATAPWPAPVVGRVAPRAAVAPLRPVAVGSTGTTTLPAMPAALASLAIQRPADTGVVAAAPFRVGGASRADRGRALQCLTAAIYYEAAGEPDAGQQAVAQVVLNRARHPAFPGTVCGVVYQGSEGPGCQFSFACDGALTRHLPAPAGWARAAGVAALALAGRVYAPVGLATHYHTYAVTPAWNRSLVLTDAVGAHLFHRWKGWWGTPAAFSRRYAGGEPEPEPGPHLPLRAPDPLPSSSAVPAAITPAAPIPPGYHASGTPRPAALPEDSLPPASTILPRWRDSGTLR